MDMKTAVEQVAQELYDSKKAITASDLVEAARPASSPAHNAFEWDNKVAGHEFRLQQARRWLRTVTITYEAQEERLIHVPSITFEGEGEYKPISVVVDNRNDYERAMAGVVSRLEAAKAAVEELSSAAKAPKARKTAARVRKHVEQAISAAR